MKRPQLPQISGAMLGKGAERVGTIGVLLFASCLWMSTTGHEIGLVVTVGAFIFSLAAWRGLVREPVFVACALFAAYLAARTAWAIAETPDMASEYLRWVRPWFLLLLFPCVGWFLAGHPDRIAAALLLALVGLVVGFMTDKDWGQLHKVWTGELRTGFRFRIIAFGLYSASAILGLLVLAPRLVVGSGRQYAVRSAIWLAILAAVAVAFIATQSRGAWLAAVVVFPPVLFLRYRSALAGVRDWPARVWALLFLVGLVLITVFAVGFNAVTTRMMREQTVIDSVVRGQIDDLPRSSVSWRLDANRFALSKWLERPLFGWGPISSRQMIFDSNRPDLWLPREDGTSLPMAQFHNGYLEVLVHFGLVGTLLFATVVGLLLKGIWVAYRKRVAARDYALLVAGVFGLTAVWSLFVSNVQVLDWRGFWFLLAGTAYAFRLRSWAHD